MEQKNYKVILSSSAQKDIERFEIDDAIQLVKDIKNYLETLPPPFGKTRIKIMTGSNPTLYRLRSIDYLAYYRIHLKEVVVLAITHKKDSKKILKKLR